MGSEDEGDGLLISGVQVGDAGSLVLISRHVTPPQPSRLRVDQKPTVLLFYRDLNTETVDKAAGITPMTRSHHPSDCVTY